MHAQLGVPLVQVARSPVSQLSELWPCIRGTANRDCPWASLLQEVLWTRRLVNRSCCLLSFSNAVSTC